MSMVLTDIARREYVEKVLASWTPSFPGERKPKLAVWYRNEDEVGLSGFHTEIDRDNFRKGDIGPFLRRVTGNEYPQMPSRLLNEVIEHDLRLPKMKSVDETPSLKTYQRTPLPLTAWSKPMIDYSDPRCLLKGSVSLALEKTLDDAYDCTRSWEAWTYNTMTVDDFDPVDDRLDVIIEDVVDAIMVSDEVHHALMLEKAIKDIPSLKQDHGPDDLGPIIKWYRERIIPLRGVAKLSDLVKAKKHPLADTTIEEYITPRLEQIKLSEDLNERETALEVLRMMVMEFIASGDCKDPAAWAKSVT